MHVPRHRSPSPCFSACLADLAVPVIGKLNLWFEACITEEVTGWLAHTFAHSSAVFKLFSCSGHEASSWLYEDGEMFFVSVCTFVLCIDKNDLSFSKYSFILDSFIQIILTKVFAAVVCSQSKVMYVLTSTHFISFIQSQSALNNPSMPEVVMPSL